MSILAKALHDAAMYEYPCPESSPFIEVLKGYDDESATIAGDEFIYLIEHADVYGHPIDNEVLRRAEDDLVRIFTEKYGRA